MSLDDVSQRKLGLHLDPDRAVLKTLAQLHEDVTIRVDHDGADLYVLRRRDCLSRLITSPLQAYDYSTRFDGLYEPRGIGPAARIERHISVADTRLEGRARVVVDLVDTEILDKCSIAFQSRRYDVGAGPFGDLDRDMSHAAGGAVDQHFQTSERSGSQAERLPSGQRNHGRGCGLPGRYIIGDSDDRSCGRDDVISAAADMLRKSRHAEHLVPLSKIRYIRTYGHDRSSHVPAQNSGKVID